MYQMTHDPGHAWLIVPIEEIDALGLADEISDYSYTDEYSVCLEEDSDAGLFIQKMASKAGQTYQDWCKANIAHVYTDNHSIIRSLPSYKAKAAK